MKTNTPYHIDVTPEEDSLFREEIIVENNKADKKTMSKSTFTKIFFAVFGLHIIGIGAIALCSSSPALANDSQSTTKQENPKDLLSSNSTTTNSTASVQKNVNATPTPTATPNAVSSKQVAKKESGVHPDKSQADIKTKTYIVKQGDTVYSIAKKYRLNVKRLVQINKIKDENKIRVGQTLNFM